jgi:hypothetical protein
VGHYGSGRRRWHSETLVLRLGLLAAGWRCAYSVMYAYAREKVRGSEMTRSTWISSFLVSQTLSFCFSHPYGLWSLHNYHSPNLHINNHPLPPLFLSRGLNGGFCSPGRRWRFEEDVSGSGRWAFVSQRLTGEEERKGMSWFRILACLVFSRVGFLCQLDEI